MDVEASDKTNCSVGDDGNFNFILLSSCSNNISQLDVWNPVSCDDADYDDDDDDDDEPLSKRLSRMSNLGTCNCAVPLKKKCTSAMPVKRLTSFSNNTSHSDVRNQVSSGTCNHELPIKKRKRSSNNRNSLHNSVKKSKVSSYDDHNEDKDDTADKLFSSLDKEIDLIKKSFEECKMKKQVEEEILQSIKRDIEECDKELRNKKTQVSCVRKINEIHHRMQGKHKECVMEIVAIEGLIGERKKELVVKEMELEQVKGNISKEIELRQVIDKDRERKEEQLNALSQKIGECTVELKAKEKDLDAMKKLVGIQAAKLQSERKKLLEVIEVKNKVCSLIKEFDSKQKQYQGREEKLESNKKHIEGMLKELGSRIKLKGRISELESEKKEFENQLKGLESEKEIFESQMKGIKSKEEELEGRAKELELEKKRFESQVEAFKSKEKQLEAQVKNHESKMVTSNMDDQLSRTIGGTSSQLLPNEQNEILVTLRESSNPAKLVLDIIHNPSMPLCKKDDNGLVIDDWRVYLLETLMGMSPIIKPRVREQALKLAHDFKANIKGNTENSLGVLGFLLLLSIYGLVTYFDEGEVLELFAFVAQHKIAVELFRTLGFAHKVDLLRKHVQNAKLICESSCMETDSIEIKDKARDQEISILEFVLQCISESEDRLNREIEHRILVVKAIRGTTVPQ